VDCAGENECIMHRYLPEHELKAKHHKVKERRTAKQLSNTSWRVA